MREGQQRGSRKSRIGLQHLPRVLVLCTLWKNWSPSEQEMSFFYVVFPIHCQFQCSITITRAAFISLPSTGWGYPCPCYTLPPSLMKTGTIVYWVQTCQLEEQLLYTTHAHLLCCWAVLAEILWSWQFLLSIFVLISIYTMKTWKCNDFYPDGKFNIIKIEGIIANWIKAR